MIGTMVMVHYNLITTGTAPFQSVEVGKDGSNQSLNESKIYSNSSSGIAIHFNKS